MTTTDHGDIREMSDDDLMNEWTGLSQQVEAGKERCRAFSAEHQRRTRKAQLERQMGGVSEEDMALLQEIKAEGIPTEEAVGSDL